MLGTVKQLKDTLEAMKKIYQFSDDKTQITIERDVMSCRNDVLEIYTTDEKTGVKIQMTKSITE